MPPNVGPSMNSTPPENLHVLTVQGFGEEWQSFDQTGLPESEALAYFESYFAPFRWDLVGPASTGFDMGCGSGRWAKLLAPRVGHIHCIDPSRALEVAKRNLAGHPNITFHQATVDTAPLSPASMDFGISLGMLHHVPDTAAAIKTCATLLKPGAPFLIYLYYRFDNQPAWYRTLWEISELARDFISRLPHAPRVAITSLIAALIYWPLARLSKFLAKVGYNTKSQPLAFYRDASFYTMRTDSMDRFGTRLEHRFTRIEIVAMLQAAGCDDIRFSNQAPYWCVCAVRK
jgi:SAM-dependent methyltransferase